MDSICNQEFNSLTWPEWIGIYPLAPSSLIAVKPSPHWRSPTRGLHWHQDTAWCDQAVKVEWDNHQGWMITFSVYQEVSTSSGTVWYGTLQTLFYIYLQTRNSRKLFCMSFQLCDTNTVSLAKAREVYFDFPIETPWPLPSKAVISGFSAILKNT